MIIAIGRNEVMYIRRFFKMGKNVNLSEMEWFKLCRVRSYLESVLSAYCPLSADTVSPICTGRRHNVLSSSLLKIT
jgi:hypothetical protein